MLVGLGGERGKERREIRVMGQKITRVRYNFIVFSFIKADTTTSHPEAQGPSLPTEVVLYPGSQAEHGSSDLGQKIPLIIAKKW
jgi:hypothetical protein